ncbi:MAG TPA: glycosyltransferase family 4 protein [Ignavibacteriaceae bacterium]|nr:glycosyltransferase family 4 protein [Ignavibacteriaceae bacterium]
MKILQIASQIPLPANDGGKISIWGVAKYLALRGNEIHFVAYKKRTEISAVENELRKYTTPYILDINTDDSILGAIKNLFSRVPYNISKYHRKELKIFLIEFLKKNKIDLVIVNNLHMGWVIDVIKPIRNIPIILRQENVEMMIMKRFYEKQTNLVIRFFAYLQYKKFLKYEPNLSEKFDKCIMISQVDDNLIRDLNPSIKTSVIPVGVDSNLLKVKKNNVIPFSIVHIGQMNWLPNYDGLQWYLNEVFPGIVEKLPHSKLFIYGGGSFDKLKILPSVKNNVEVVGFVKDIWASINDKALAVIPLRIGSGIRVKIIEMLAAGQSIITTSVGKEGIPTNDGEHIIVADSKEEMISKTVNFFNGKYNTDMITNNARKLIEEQFTWEKIAERFEFECKSLLNQKLQSNG